MKQNFLLSLYILFCLFLSGSIYHFPTTGIDDANIYFSYMKNFADGHGFVYNIGGENVEGFTSLLWTLIGIIIYTFTDRIEICLLIINFILLFLSLKLSLKIISLFFQKQPECISNYTILFLGMLIAFTGFYEWAVYSLLETGLWIFELILFTYLLIAPYFYNDFSFKKSSLLMSMVFPFFIITRPESMLIGIVILGIRVLQLIIEKIAIKELLKQTSFILLAYITSLVLLINWRLYYFGFPLPNTYYVKATERFVDNLLEGSGYLKAYIFDVNPSILILFILIIGWLLNSLKERDFSNQNKAIAVFIVITTIGLGIPLYTGGDHFNLFRFCQFYSPIFHICFISIIYYFSKRIAFLSKILDSKRYIVLVVIAFSVIPHTSWYSLFKNNQYSINGEFYIAKYNRESGRMLNTFFKESKPSIGVITAGLANTYDGTINDVLGLNNIEVAHTLINRPHRPYTLLKSHRAFNKYVFLRQHPDLFLLEFVTDSSTYVPYMYRKTVDKEFNTIITKYIYKDPVFKSVYQPVYIYNKHTKSMLFAYIYKDAIKKFNPSVYVIKIL